MSMSDELNQIEVRVIQSLQKWHG